MLMGTEPELLRRGLSASRGWLRPLCFRLENFPDVQPLQPAREINELLSVRAVARNNGSGSVGTHARDLAERGTLAEDGHVSNHLA